jgi:hypothetical protein
MPNRHPAFCAGEHVKFAKLEVLEELQARYGEDGPEGQKWIHGVLATDMTKHAGVYVRIKRVSIYHFGTVLYEFDEVGGYWLEPSIVDRSLEETSGYDIDRPAHLYYQVTTDVELDQPGTVEIHGVHDQLLYCSLRKSLGGSEAKNITEVSRIRTKSNFEARYGFDGFYDPLNSTIHEEQSLRK